MNAPRARLAAAFCLSLAVALAAFAFAPDAPARVVIGALAFVPFVIAWRAVRKG